MFSGILTYSAERGANKSKCQYCYEVTANVVNVRSQPSVQSQVLYGVTKGDRIYVDDETLYDGSGFKWIKISGEDAYVVATYLSIKENINYITPVNEPVNKKQKRYDVWQYGLNALPSWLGISMLIIFAILAILSLLTHPYRNFLGKMNENGMRKILFYSPEPYKLALRITLGLLAAFAATIILFITIGGLVWLFCWTARIGLIVVFWIIVALTCLLIGAIAYGLIAASNEGGCTIIIIIAAIAACCGAVSGLIESIQHIFYYWGEIVVDWGNNIFEVFNVFSLAVYIIKTYWNLALVFSAVPLVIFLSCAVIFLIFAGILILVESSIMKSYNVKHPCPYCGRPSEPAVYMSHGVPLPVKLQPGVWGLFTITHPVTGEKMPTLFLNGKDRLERQCFSCKSSISAQVGAERHIAIAGVPSSGKSTLVYRLVAELLRKKIENEHVAFFTDDLGSDETAVKNFIKTIANGEQMTEFPNKTQEGRHKAIQLLVQNPSHYVPYRLFVNDIAGEMFTAERSNVEDATFLMNTKMLMFVIDPYTIDFSECRLSPRMKEWYETNTHAVEIDRTKQVKINVAIDALANMVEKYAKKSKSGFDMHLKIVLTKTDTGYLGKINKDNQIELQQFICHDLGLEAEMYNLSTMFKNISFTAISAVQKADESGISRLLNDIISAVGIDFSKVTGEGLFEKRMKLEEMKRKKREEDNRFNRQIQADKEAELRRQEREREQRRRAAEAAKRKAAEEERKKQEEMLKLKEASAGVTFKGCKFGNTDYNCNVLNKYGGPLYSEDMRYLSAKYNYVAERTVSDVEFFIKLYSPSRELYHGTSSPKGYTASVKINVVKGEWNNQYIFGWGNESTSSYPPGEYLVEVWRNGYKLYSSVAVIKAGNSGK